MVWLIKDPGLHDTYEPGLDDDWFEEGEWEVRKASHQGWSLRSVRY